MPDHWRFETLPDVLKWRAERTPDAGLFTFLRDGESDEASLSYKQLDQRARAVAVQLLTQGQVGDRALVVLEPGLDYIAALLGCFYAGVVAVPVYPPDPFRIARTLPRLQAIFGSADCRMMISSASVLGGPESVLRSVCPTGTIEIESVSDALASDYEAPDEPDSQALALLQYTSGTTGVPRGVPITFANLLHNLRGMERVLDVPDAKVLLWLPPYHDLGLIGGIFLPMFAGRETVLMSPLSFVQSPVRWLQGISRHRATTSASPNFGFELCVRKITDAQCEGLNLSSWQIAASGAEPVRAETLDRFCEKFEPYGFRRKAFVPAYGMAETTLMVSVADKHAEPSVRWFDSAALKDSVVKQVSETDAEGTRRLVACGKAEEDIEVEIVDPQTRQTTDGVGEIWVRSPSVSSGYWGLPEVSAERFNQQVANTGESDFFRTGDLGFVHQQELFIVGRRKELIILAGRNFYPQDLELAVQSADAAFKTDGGAALSVENDNQEQLVFFQEVQRPKKQDLQQLLTIARSTLTEEIGQEPLRVVLLPVGELPKTSSGKTRRAECWQQLEQGVLTVLAEWSAEGSDSSAVTNAIEHEPPLGETEVWLAQVWQRVLGTEGLSRHDSFFKLGGRSLQVTEMLTQVAERTGIVLQLKSLFDHPTLADLASHIVSEVSRNDGPSQSEQIERVPVDLCEPQSLSSSQQRFWMVEQLGIAGGANVPIALRVNGNVDCEKLSAAVNQLVNHHQVLQCCFTGSGVSVTQQISECEPVTAERLELPADATLEDALDLPWVWRAFDLSAPPLLRVATCELNGESIVLLVLHHLVCDGQSIEILLQDLATLLDGDSPADAAEFSHTEADRSAIEASKGYWAERLEDVPATIDLPLDRQQTPPTANELAITDAPLSTELAATLDRTAADCEATPFLVYLAVFQWLLSKYANAGDIGTGIAVAGRDDPTDWQAVGCFINTVPLFNEVNQAGTLKELLRATRDQVATDLQHTALPWEEIVEAANVAREPGRMPLVQTFFVHDDRPHPVPSLDGATVLDAATDYRGLGVFDLSLVVETGRPQPRLKLIHDRRALDPRLAQRLLESYLAVVEQFTKASATPLVDLQFPAGEERCLLADGGASLDYPAVDYDHVGKRFARQASLTPSAVAIECAGERATYAELVAMSEQIARHLIASGVGQGDRAGLLLDRSVAAVAAMLGVWRIGAAYVPLDPSYPESRIRLMTDDAGLACVVSDQEGTADAIYDTVTLRLSDLLASAVNAILPSPKQLSGNDLAYLIYTSGSTGRPKGVMVPQRAVVNLLASFAHDTRLTASDRVLGSTTISFDISVLELFLPLVTGSTLVLADSKTVGDANKLSKLIAEKQITYLQGTPSTFRMLHSVGWRASSNQRVLCGGEELTPDVAQTLLATAGEVWNVYGPTETTIWSTVHRLDSASSPIPIGRPLARTRCYILNDDSQLVPMGVWGQLAIAGDGVADGYWQRPELTAERFPPDPFTQSDSARMYLTGDQARWNADGLLEFRGRGDNQIKIRGHRVELGEIETALCAHGGISEAAVVATDHKDGRAALIAYVVSQDGKPVDPAILREHLAGSLPAYMTPSAFVLMDLLPRTDNGKLNRGALPRELTGAARSTPLVAPRTPLEEQLAEWVCGLLRIEEVGIHDNFFEIGGQSLLTTQLVVRMRDELGVEPPLRSVYEQPTIAQWAELVLREQLANESDSELLEQLADMTDEEAESFLEGLGQGE